MAAIAEVEKYAWLHSEKKTKDDDKCWADAKCLGKDFPAIDSLEFIKKELPAMGEKPTLFVFWAKMAKGMFSSFHQLTEVSKMFPGVNIVGVGIDAVKDAALKMLKKEGEAMSTFNIDALSFDYPLAYDTDMKVKKAFMAIAGTKILTPGTVRLVCGFAMRPSETPPPALAQLNSTHTHIRTHAHVHIVLHPRAARACDQGQQGRVDGSAQAFLPH